MGFFSMINTKEKKKVGRMSRFLRVFAIIFGLFFMGNAFAAGYTCSTTRKYTSCPSGQYLSNCGTTYNGQTATPAYGNSCKSCPSGYTCAGGAVCPKSSSASTSGYVCNDIKKYTSCNEGYYLSDCTVFDGSDAPTPQIGNSCNACPTGYECIGGEVCPDVARVTITLNGNGGTPTSSSKTCKVGQACSLPTNTFTKTGHDFVGWSTSSTATTATYVNSGTFSADTTLYAVWSPIFTTISLDANGATSTDHTTETYGVYGVGAFLDASRYNKMTTSGTPLTKPSKSFTVTYDANGGTVPLTSATATSTFDGYYSTESANNGSGTQYINASGYITSNGITAAKALVSDTTWYAKWSGGTVKLQLPAARTGYTFMGWYDAASGGNKIGDAGATYIPTKNITLYAVWEANCSKITLNANGGTFNSNMTDYYTGAFYNGVFYKKYGDSAIYSDSKCTTALQIWEQNRSIMGGVTRTGWVVVGWAASANRGDITATKSVSPVWVTGKTVLLGSSEVDGTGTLYAVWAKECTVPSNGTCELTVDLTSNATTSSVTYTTSCNTGYTISGNMYLTKPHRNV